MKPECKHCGEKKDLRPWSGPPRIRFMCGKCGVTFSVSSTRKSKPKMADDSISAIYRLTGAKQ